MNAEQSQEQNKRSVLLWLLGITVGSASTLLPLWYFGKLQYGRSTLLATATVLIIVKIYPELYGRAWFWLTMTVMAALQIPLVMLLSWPNTYISSRVMMAVVLPDAALMIGVITLVQKIFRGSTMPRP